MLGIRTIRQFAENDILLTSNDFNVLPGFIVPIAENERQFHKIYLKATGNYQVNFKCKFEVPAGSAVYRQTSAGFFVGVAGEQYAVQGSPGALVFNIPFLFVGNCWYEIKLHIVNGSEAGEISFWCAQGTTISSLPIRLDAAASKMETIIF